MEVQINNLGVFCPKIKVMLKQMSLQKNANWSYEGKKQQVLF